MQKYLVLAFAATLCLSACNQNTDSTAPAASESSAPTEQMHAEEHHDHKHDDDMHNKTVEYHEHHDHEHGHHHDEGDNYQCDNGKKASIAVHDHEGEIEAHVDIDNVVYDMHPDTAKANQYISHEVGINDKPMLMTLDGDNASFSDEGNGIFMTCKKAAS